MYENDEISLDPSNTKLINKYELDGNKLINMKYEEYIDIAKIATNKLYNIEASHAVTFCNKMKAYHNDIWEVFFGPWRFG